MGAVEAVVNIIKGELNQCHTDHLGGVDFELSEINGEPLYRIIRETPPLCKLLHPDPDVEIENEIRDDSDVLGTYTSSEKK